MVATFYGNIFDDSSFQSNKYTVQLNVTETTKSDFAYKYGRKGTLHFVLVRVLSSVSLNFCQANHSLFYSFPRYLLSSYLLNINGVNITSVFNAYNFLK